jgi:diadenosine tetraphosphate (Ap4A) HIT family hydrolase
VRFIYSMILTRAQLTKLFTSTLQLLAISTDPREGLARYHDPPQGVSYQENPTVFGQILEGKLPCSEIRETETTLTFRDRSPRAPLHALVIPKRCIRSVFELDPTHDLELVEEMKKTALETIKVEHPKSFEERDYILCFHVPPFISVGHLHLHVLAPASDMNILYRYGKYRVGTIWCTSLNTVLDLLSEGKPFL